MSIIIPKANKEISLISNASGCWAKTKEQILEIVKHTKISITSKTATLYPSKGNPQPNFYSSNNNYYVLNTMGIPNEGYEYYKQLYPLFYNENKTFILSLDASNSNDLIKMLKDYDDFIYSYKNSKENTTSFEFSNSSSLDLVEINISCPNILSKNLIAFNISELTKILTLINNLQLKSIILGFKIPPFLDIVMLEKVISLFIYPKFSKFIGFIVCCNAVPGGLNPEALNGQFGAISGSFCKLLSLAMVKRIKPLLENSNIIIIGCGGIEKYNDVLDYLDCGASAVQIGSILMNGDFSILNKITSKL